MEFGEKLKAIREAKGMSLDEMAKYLGTTKQALSRYERGERTPKITVAAEFAKILGIGLCTLTGTEEVKRIEEPTDYSYEERQLVTAYRLAEPSAQQYAFEILLNHPAIKKEDSESGQTA